MDLHPSSSDAVHILCLEDSVVDAQLISYALRKEWPRASIDRVETREEFLAALRQKELDLILSDYSIPGFSGLEALELVRQRRPEIPYIFFSGTIGEERAVEALKRGATDYVIKDRPGRLIPAVRKALTSAPPSSQPGGFALLASGIAHHLNNVLTPILFALPLLRQKTTAPGAEKLIDLIESCSREAADVVRRLQHIARPPNEGGAARGSAAAEAPPAVAAPRKARDAILVIDDDEPLRQTLEALLESCGERVILAADGDEGIATFRARRPEIKVVLTDITMPGMSGAEVIRELRTIDPTVGIVIMSGLNDPDVMVEESQRMVFLRKPMTKADLFATLQKVVHA